MERFSLQLNTMPRILDYSYPLNSIGYIKDNFYNTHRKQHQTIDVAIEFSKSKESIQKMDGKTYQYSYPCLVTRCPGHEYGVASTAPWNVLYFSYDVKIKPLLTRLGINFEIPGIEIKLLQDFKIKLQLLFDLVSRLHVHGNVDRLDQLAIQMISETLLTPSSQQTNTSDQKQIHVQIIASYLQLNCCKNVDLDTLLRRNGISRRSFYREWKKHYTESPLQFVINKRLEQACHLLIETECSTIEIAERCGFSTPAGFFRVFRKKQGLTPQQFREVCP